MASYPTGVQVHKYLTSYAEHFGLEPHIRLNASIQHITFDEEQQKWIIKLDNHAEKYFDKIVIANGGLVGRPNTPSIEGLEKFAGLSIHSQAFKKPQDFAGKRVMVVGFGNSAADTATQLAGIADQVYIAHRHGARILPRGINGQPFDHIQSFRLFTTQNTVLRYFPKFGERISDHYLRRLQDKSFALRPEWDFEPAQKIPLVSDDLVACLTYGSVKSVKGVKRILNATEVQLEDGKKFDVDVLIWCTGYKPDFSMIDPRFNPTVRTPSSEWSAALGSNGKSLFRLYHNIFSLEKPDSLAFLGCVRFEIGEFQILDMASMAIAQVWKGASKLPNKAVMNAEADTREVWLADLASRRPNVSPGNVDAATWTRAIDDLAGTGINEYLGYGWDGWLFWLKDRALCNSLMGGIWTPHIYRVFNGKRKKWDGAKQTIEQLNARIAASKKAGKAKKA